MMGTLSGKKEIMKSVLKKILLVANIYAILFAFVMTFLLGKIFFVCYGIYDDVVQLRNSQPEQSSFMIHLRDSIPDIKLRHTYVPMDSISPYLKKAVIAGEDPGFFFHPGFDLRAIANAYEVNSKMGKIKYGGSTITQQLAKNMFLNGERSMARKAKELVYAVLMENELGKERILELYLNYAQWGENIFGCKEACLAFYGKDCSNLTLDQAINLAAVLSAPTKLQPEMSGNDFMELRKSIVEQGVYAGRAHQKTTQPSP